MSQPMQCEADGKGKVCPCSMVTASGGECGVFGPPPTMREAFPYLFDSRPEACRLCGEDGGDCAYPCC